MEATATNLEVFFDELGAGAFKPLLEEVLSKVSLAVMTDGSDKIVGTIKIDLKLAKKSETDQVIVGYKVAHSLPTVKGKRGEEVKGASAYHVGRGGRLLVEQPGERWDGQEDMFGGGRVTE